MRLKLYESFVPIAALTACNLSWFCVAGPFECRDATGSPVSCSVTNREGQGYYSTSNLNYQGSSFGSPYYVVQSFPFVRQSAFDFSDSRLPQWGGIQGMSLGETSMDVPSFHWPSSMRRSQIGASTGVSTPYRDPRVVLLHPPVSSSAASWDSGTYFAEISEPHVETGSSFNNFGEPAGESPYQAVQNPVTSRPEIPYMEANGGYHDTAKEDGPTSGDSVVELQQLLRIDGFPAPMSNYILQDVVSYQNSVKNDPIPESLAKGTYSDQVTEASQVSAIQTLSTSNPPEHEKVVPTESTATGYLLQDIQQRQRDSLQTQREPLQVKEAPLASWEVHALQQPLLWKPDEKSEKEPIGHSLMKSIITEEKVSNPRVEHGDVTTSAMEMSQRVDATEESRRESTTLDSKIHDYQQNASQNLVDGNDFGSVNFAPGSPPWQSPPDQEERSPKPSLNSLVETDQDATVAFSGQPAPTTDTEGTTDSQGWDIIGSDIVGNADRSVDVDGSWQKDEQLEVEDLVSLDEHVDEVPTSKEGPEIRFDDESADSADSIVSDLGNGWIEVYGETPQEIDVRPFTFLRLNTADLSEDQIPFTVVTNLNVEPTPLSGRDDSINNAAVSYISSPKFDSPYNSMPQVNRISLDSGSNTSDESNLIKWIKSYETETQDSSWDSSDLDSSESSIDNIWETSGMATLTAEDGNKMPMTSGHFTRIISRGESVTTSSTSDDSSTEEELSDVRSLGESEEVTDEVMTSSLDGESSSGGDRQTVRIEQVGRRRYNRFPASIPPQGQQRISSRGGANSFLTHLPIINTTSTTTTTPLPETSGLLSSPDLTIVRDQKTEKNEAKEDEEERDEFESSGLIPATVLDKPGSSTKDIGVVPTLPSEIEPFLEDNDYADDDDDDDNETELKEPVRYGTLGDGGTLKPAYDVFAYCYPFEEDEIESRCRDAEDRLNVSGVYVPMMMEIQRPQTRSWYSHIQKLKATTKLDIVGTAYERPDWKLIVEILSQNKGLFSGILLEWIGPEACISKIPLPTQRQLDSIRKYTTKNILRYFFREQNYEACNTTRPALVNYIDDDNLEWGFRYPRYIHPTFACFGGQEGLCYKAFHHNSKDACDFGQRRFAFNPYEGAGGRMLHLFNETCGGLPPHDLYGVL